MMKKEQLCPHCKTGKDSYLLDNRNPFCPYLGYHTGTSCSKFVRMNEERVVNRRIAVHQNI